MNDGAEGYSDDVADDSFVAVDWVALLQSPPPLPYRYPVNTPQWDEPLSSAAAKLCQSHRRVSVPILPGRKTMTLGKFFDTAWGNATGAEKTERFTMQADAWLRWMWPPRPRTRRHAPPPLILRIRQR